MQETLVDAVSSGDEMRILKATRELVANQLQSTESGRDMAALSKQMQELTARISELEKRQGTKKKQSALDKARAAARGR